jgi:hypothetical protein
MRLCQIVYHVPQRAGLRIEIVSSIAFHLLSDGEIEGMVSSWTGIISPHHRLSGSQASPRYYLMTCGFPHRL